MNRYKNKFAVALAQLGKKQVDLLYEVQRRGYPRLNQQQLSAYARGATVGPQADAVLKLCDMIIEEWKHPNGRRQAQ
ncbi:MAG: hypothetical protein IJN40_05115 [Clostridia bacterium]|nr:hypothetical protein [Clostridia bacterium]